jgi:hypothetical protein
MSIENNGYRNFDMAVYVSDFDMARMKDDGWLEESFEVISRSIRISKVYLETFRHGKTIERELVEKAIRFFKGKGIRRISGGIMPNASKPGIFRRSFCFTDAAEREQFRKVVVYTAGLFDEIMFDDMFTFNCRCAKCREAKGDLGWTEYRLKVMEEVYAKLCMETAKSVNPKVTLILKFPNWYEQYQFAGYNLEAGPRLFDNYYAGTETRDSENTTQHLQTYQSYTIMRYFGHIRPGRFNGGWVDPGTPGSWDRFAQQLDLTLFAKPKEITIWAYGLLLHYIKGEGGARKILGLPAAVAGDSFAKVDSFLALLGRPVGVASYKPFHSFGESYIHNYLGMIGIPIDLHPSFPEDSPIVFLSEQASRDPGIVDKIQKQLANEKTVVMTSQLYRALIPKGIRNIAEFYYTDKKVAANRFVLRKVMHHEFDNTYISDRPILFAQMEYGLTEAEELAQCVADENRFPLILTVRGYEKGDFFLLNMPENISDLYSLPREIQSLIRRILMPHIPVVLDGPAHTSLFVYDNDTFIVQSFLRSAEVCPLSVRRPKAALEDLMTGDIVSRVGETDGESVFELRLRPNAYRVFRIGSEEIPSKRGDSHRHF